MIGVVADTSIYVSALVFGGVPRTALEKAQRRPYRLVVSVVIRAELVATLQQKFGWPPARIERIGPLLWTDAFWQDPVQVEASRDPDDDHVLGCALAAHAPIIVTGDKDLLTLHPFREIAVLTPAQFVALQIGTRGETTGE